MYETPSGASILCYPDAASLLIYLQSSSTAAPLPILLGTQRGPTQQIYHIFPSAYGSPHVAESILQKLPGSRSTRPVEDQRFPTFVKDSYMPAQVSGVAALPPNHWPLSYYIGPDNAQVSHCGFDSFQQGLKLHFSCWGLLGSQTSLWTSRIQEAPYFCIGPDKAQISHLRSRFVQGRSRASFQFLGTS